MSEIKTVCVPSCDNHEGIYKVHIRLRWVCPVCGRPRGTVHNAVSFDGSLSMRVDGWQNDCGHTDKYADVRKEALENGLNIATEVIPSDKGGCV